MPVVAVLGGGFLLVMFYLLAVGFGVTGSVFGRPAAPGQATQAQQGNPNSVQGGGPPAAVMVQLKTLRERIAAHPNDDVALTQLADMYLTVQKYNDAIPLYQRALKINPNNSAAQTGLEEARSGLSQSQ